MSTLSASATIAIGEATPLEESVSIVVLPLAIPGEGRGRLVHPTLGTFDYEFCPDSWSGFRGDVVIAPVWSSITTLAGAINTLWAGHIQDVVVSEHWTDDISMKAGDFDTLQQFFQDPPDPTEDEYVEWYPQYASTLGFRVILLDVAGGGGSGVTTTKFGLDEGWIEGPVTLTMRIVARVE